MPSIIGLKQSSKDEDFDKETVARMGDEFRLFMGLPELAYELIPKVACGLIVALGNVVPDKVAELCTLATEGEMADAAVLHQDLSNLNDAAFRDTSPIRGQVYGLETGANPIRRMPTSLDATATRRYRGHGRSLGANWSFIAIGSHRPQRYSQF